MIFDVQKKLTRSNIYIIDIVTKQRNQKLRKINEEKKELTRVALGVAEVAVPAMGFGRDLERFKIIFLASFF